MVNFIIYEDNKTLSETYNNVIRQVMGKHDNLYKVYQFYKYSSDLLKTISSLDGPKIYVLDIQVPGKSGLDFAREIRASKDFNSQIIIVTAHKELLENSFNNRSLVLNLISKYDNCQEQLYLMLMQAFLNVCNKKSYTFKNNGLICNLPYEEILYIYIDQETEAVKLVTLNSSYELRHSITKVYKELDDPRFLKIHQSCIVNVQNIRQVDFVNRIVYFDNGINTSLFSRNYKKDLLGKMLIK